MASNKPGRNSAARKQKLAEAMAVLTALQFGPRQRNEVAAYTLLALLDIDPAKAWSKAENPLRGITPIIDFIAENYGLRYAPNTRETIRDEAVKFFAEAGLLLRNPDKPDRPTNSGKTVYQVEPSALALLRTLGTQEWPGKLAAYLVNVEAVKREIARHRELTRVTVTYPDGQQVTLSPGGQNPLIKAIIEDFCPHFVPGGRVFYVGDTENKFARFDASYLAELGVVLDGAAKMPDVMIHCPTRNWLLLVEAVTTAGPVDGKRRKELKELFAGCKAGIVFVTAFDTRRVMQSFLASIAWESEVWIAEDPAHMIHFNGDKFLGPYPDTLPSTNASS